MSAFFQQAVNGISLGSTYAVFAMSCTLIFGVLNIVNMAQGAFFMGGAYVGLEAARMGMPMPLALMVALVGGGILGIVSELVVFRTLRARGGHRWMGLIASLALARLLVGVAQEMFGTQVQRYPAFEMLTLCLGSRWRSNSAAAIDDRRCVDRVDGAARLHASAFLRRARYSHSRVQ